jgi:hypothetical protein
MSTDERTDAGSDGPGRPQQRPQPEPRAASALRGHLSGASGVAAPRQVASAMPPRRQALPGDERPCFNRGTCPTITHDAWKMGGYAAIVVLSPTKFPQRRVSTAAPRCASYPQTGRFNRAPRVSQGHGLSDDRQGEAPMSRPLATAQLHVRIPPHEKDQLRADARRNRCEHGCACPDQPDHRSRSTIAHGANANYLPRGSR